MSEHHKPRLRCRRYPRLVSRRLRPIEPALPTAEELSSRLEMIVRRMGVGCDIKLVITEGTVPMAGARGLTIGRTSSGTIEVSKGLLKLLNSAELDFVLAHEAAHIWQNDVVAAGTFAVLRKFTEAAAQEDVGVLAMLAIWDIAKLVTWKNGQLPPWASLLRETEEQADYVAVSVTGDLAAAKTTLLKLSGFQLDSPSHTWELFGVNLPAMTMGERISTLERRLPAMLPRPIPHLR